MNAVPLGRADKRQRVVEATGVDDERKGLVVKALRSRLLDIGGEAAEQVEDGRRDANADDSKDSH